MSGPWYAQRTRGSLYRLRYVLRSYEVKYIDALLPIQRFRLRFVLLPSMDTQSGIIGTYGEVMSSEKKKQMKITRRFDFGVRLCEMVMLRIYEA